MTPQQIRIIQESFLIVRANRELVTDVFYTQLFNRNPSLGAMFPADLSEQKTKLFKALQAVVGMLTNVEAVVPILTNLGARHTDYGVRDEHYSDVGHSLIEALAIALGDGFTAEVEAAWTAAYELISSTMQSSVALRAA